MIFAIKLRIRRIAYMGILPYIPSCEAAMLPQEKGDKTVDSTDFTADDMIPLISAHMTISRHFPQFGREQIEEALTESWHKNIDPMTLIHAAIHRLLASIPSVDYAN